VAHAETWRLFIGFPLPAGVVERVRIAIEPWRAALPKARWVPPDNWHVTVKFLGSTALASVGWVTEQTRAVAAAASSVETDLTHLGAFPSARRARVLWVGLDDRAGRMAEIALALDHALAPAFRAEARPFAAHLTVARCDPPQPLADRSGPIEISGSPFAIDRIVLFLSHLRRPAPTYEPIADIPLATPAG
jgi:RNA 2',3'-cyclic 3'-phosphodiesterase